MPIVAQQGYEIKIELEGNQDTVFFLAHYYGDKFYMADTCIGRKGEALFQGKEPLKQGIYLLANQKKEKLIEFLVGDEQSFSIQAGLLSNESGVRVEGSWDNESFFEHIRLMNKLQKSLQENDSLSAKNLQEAAQALRDNTFQKKTASLVARIFSAMQDPVVPSEIQHNKEAAYRYYKTHFWDGFNFADDRLLRTPLLPMKLKTYFDQLIVPEADTVIVEAKRLMNAANENQEMTDFLAWHFISEYQNPKIMGLDKVFVYFVDHYFDTGKVKNLTPSILEKLDERVSKMRQSLIGLKAPDMWLIDTTGNYRSFNELTNRFTIIIFWDQTCSHCKKEMETINQLFTSRKYDVGVYAVNTTNDFEGWKHYLTEKKYPFFHVNGIKSITPDFHNLYDIYSVPVIYLLDKNKTIIAKKISAEQLDNVIFRHQKEK
ncbi:hypothetical protein MASR2M12_01810 [Bacteroidales bacterium]